eukprot:5173140-Amphidinium_carterae.2
MVAKAVEEEAACGSLTDADRNAGLSSYIQSPSPLFVHFLWVVDVALMDQPHSLILCWIQSVDGLQSSLESSDPWALLLPYAINDFINIYLYNYPTDFPQQGQQLMKQD